MTVSAPQVHRVYIVDHAGHAIGAISVTDVIRLVLSPSLTAYSTDAVTDGEGEAKSSDEVLASPVIDSSATKLSQELTALLSRFTAGEFIVRDGVKIDKLIDVPHDVSAAQVLRELSSNNLSALPVYREDSEGVPDLMSFIPYAYPTEKRYVGWVDAGDLCGLLLDKGLRQKSEGVLGLLKSLVRDSDRTSVAAVNYSNNDPFWAIPAERSMSQVVRVLGNCKVHRLAVVDVDEGNRIIGVITQSAVSRLTRRVGYYVVALALDCCYSAWISAVALAAFEDTESSLSRCIAHAGGEVLVRAPHTAWRGVQRKDHRLPEAITRSHQDPAVRDCGRGTASADHVQDHWRTCCGRRRPHRC